MTDSLPPTAPRGRAPMGRFRKITAILIGTFAVLYAIAVFAGWVKIFGIPTGSMSPTIRPGDRLLSVKYKPEANEIRRGELVVVNVDGQGTLGNGVEIKGLYVDRIAALPGDIVSVADGALLVNGSRLERNGAHALPPEAAGNIHLPKFPMTIPEGHVFLLGDNFSNSLDSRYFGPVAIHRIAYRPVFRAYPPARMGKIE